MATRTYEGFSVSHAAILNGPADKLLEPTVTQGAEADWGDIYGVRTATITPDSGNFDNTGDDFVLSSWFWMNFATITVESGYIPFETIARMSGVPIVTDNRGTTTGTNPTADDYESLLLWDQDSVNVAPRPMLIRVPSRDSDGIPRVLDFVLFRVNFSPISFTGPAYKAGLVVNYTGRAVLSDKDEAGNRIQKRNPLTGALLEDADGDPIYTKAIGRLISRPQI